MKVILGDTKGGGKAISILYHMETRLLYKRDT